MTPDAAKRAEVIEEIRRWLPTESYTSIVPNDPPRCDNCGGFWESDWHREGRIDQNGQPRNPADDDVVCATAAVQMLLACYDAQARALSERDECNVMCVPHLRQIIREQAEEIARLRAEVDDWVARGKKQMAEARRKDTYGGR